ncbi:MAG: MraY family glycosyltransferase [Planctomycetota bacterium]
MPLLVLGLGLVALVVGLLATGAAVAAGRRLEALDAPGVAGQVKAAPRRVPNIGGVGIAAGIVLPLAVVGLIVGLSQPPAMHPDAAEHVDGLRGSLPGLAWLLAALLGLHALGLIDDRRPLGPWLKLGLMALPCIAVPLLTDTRMLVLLDALPGGYALSVAVTAAWLLAMTNALNFLDNMDGLAAGLAAIASGFLLFTVLAAGQWFVAGMLACVAGSCLGFLPWNFPRARIFMGDGGSLVLGFAMGFLSVRGTYVNAEAGNWYAALLPPLVLAVPLYDLATVVLLRLAQGRSPLVGDLQHVSHRLADRGLGRTGAVLALWGLAAISGVSGVLLARVDAAGAVLIAVQAAAVVVVLAALEFWPMRWGGDG